MLKKKEGRFGVRILEYLMRLFTQNSYHSHHRQNHPKDSAIYNFTVRNKKIFVLPCILRRFQFDNGNFEVQRDLFMIQFIVTHPGGAHKDEFLACAVLLSQNVLPVFRREPSAADLADETIAVLDVGGEHDPGTQQLRPPPVPP